MSGKTKSKKWITIQENDQIARENKKDGDTSNSVFTNFVGNIPKYNGVNLLSNVISRAVLELILKDSNDHIFWPKNTHHGC